MNPELQIAITAALYAGKEILKIYEDPTADFEIEQKADHSPLTLADRRSNEVIMSYLCHTPWPVISEENKEIPYEQRRQWHSEWIVDPLDGTKEFIKRNGEFTVNIAFVTDGTPVAGVIYIPVKKELYFGSKDKGAWKVKNIPEEADINSLWQQAVPLPLPQERSACVVVASRSHLSPQTASFIDQLRMEYPELSTTSIGSSIKICLVAEGSADIYPRFAPTMEWDTAAGHAIALAAGKNIYCEDGITPLRYNKENLQNPWFIVK